MDQQIRKAIFVSAIDYESPLQIGDHHLARQFARHGWKVAFISKPVTPFHRFSKNKQAVSRRIANHKLKGIHHPLGKGEVWSYVPRSLLLPRDLPLLGGEIIYRTWHWTISPELVRLLRSNGFEQVDLLYLRDPLQSYLLRQVNHSKSIFRLADNDAGFLYYGKTYAAVESELSKRVDCVVYSAQEMEDHIQDLQPKRAVYLPNGVEYDHFLNAGKSEPYIYKALTRPVVVYVGSIDFWFDFDIVNQLAKDLPNFSFVIIGPNEIYTDRFAPASNLFLIGPVNYEDLPPYLLHADMGIIPFNKNKFPALVNSIYPIKLLEYLACGLPVISTRWNEMVAINSPALLCDTYQDFRFSIEKIASSAPINKGHLQKFAAENDWSTRYQELLSIIDL